MSKPKNRSLWELHEDKRAVGGRLERNVEVDVAVVGGGIAGLTAAMRLDLEGERVAILDAGEIAHGETARTTAHLSAAIDAGYASIERSRGRDASRAVARLLSSAIDQIEQWCTAFSIDAGFKRVDAFKYAKAEFDVALLRDEELAAREAGLGVSFVDEVPLPFATAGGIRFTQQARFDALRYASALAREIARSRSLVFPNSRVVEYQEGDPCQLRTDGGVSVTAKNIVIATDSPIGVHLTHAFIEPHRTYAMAFEAPPALSDALFWDTADPYHYIRLAELAEGTRVLIVGGEDHRVGDGDASANAFARLSEFVRQRFGALREIARWSGQVNEPADGLPYIGLSAGAQRIYIATGFAGDGMTFGTAAGMLLANEILRRPDESADLFSPSRVPSAPALTKTVSDNLETVRNWIGERLVPSESSVITSESLGPGEGAIVGTAGKKIAAFRNEQRDLVQFSAVCPHMGCIVGWNDAEKSWDCPCHGSRFSADGEVIHGPATGPLKPAD